MRACASCAGTATIYTCWPHTVARSRYWSRSARRAQHSWNDSSRADGVAARWQRADEQHCQQRDQKRVDVLRARDADAEREPDARHAERIEQLGAEVSGEDGDQCERRENTLRALTQDARGQ